MGSELHGLLECNSAKLLNLKNAFCPEYSVFVLRFTSLGVYDSFFLYLMKCYDTGITTFFAEWVNKCNKFYKNVLL